MRVSQGRFPVTIPDLVENLDILSALRGPQHLLLDLIERPDFVEERIAEINQVYFQVFEQLYKIVRDPLGGSVFSAFGIWGPGKTAKVQCDAAAMISPRMFRRFAVPALAEQCAWLDYSLFHLDGMQAISHLDALLEIEELDAIEWTPQVSLPQGGDPMWYDLYRRILKAGKSVQAIDVHPHEVISLLEAVGPQGMFVRVSAGRKPRRALVKAVEAYRWPFSIHAQRKDQTLGSRSVWSLKQPDGWGSSHRSFSHHRHRPLPVPDAQSAPAARLMRRT